MTPRIITADEAKALAAKWRGYDGPYGVSWDDEGDCVVHYDDMTVARVAHFDGGHTEPLARLFAAAPDDVKSLAHTVVAQTAELASFRAIIDGRTTPPTDEEIRSAVRAGLTVILHATEACDGHRVDLRTRDVLVLSTWAAHHADGNFASATWRLIDANDRPCAWPVVAEVSP